MLTSIVGINWGDEGKGRMVDLLYERAVHACAASAAADGGTEGKAGEVSEQLAAEAAVADGVAAQEDKN